MADVDGARIIYYAAPYRWHEALFTGWLADAGHPLGAMLEGGVSCPCVTSGATYLRPLHLDDQLELELIAERVGRSSMVLRTDVRTSDGELAVRVTNTHVWTEFETNGALRSMSVPAWMRAVFDPPPDSDATEHEGSVGPGSGPERGLP
jgi:YbgC/YbaW family acyl-CoA thioester hydrolase